MGRWEEIIKALKEECKAYRKVTEKRLKQARKIVEEIEEMLDEAGMSEIDIQIESRRYRLRNATVEDFLENW